MEQSMLPYGRRKRSEAVFCGEEVNIEVSTLSTKRSVANVPESAYKKYTTGSTTIWSSECI